MWRLVLTLVAVVGCAGDVHVDSAGQATPLGAEDDVDSSSPHPEMVHQAFPRLRADFSPHGATFADRNGQSFSIALRGQGGTWRTNTCPSSQRGSNWDACSIRTERTQAGITEWWQSRQTSWEHGFDMAEGGGFFRFGSR